MIEFMLPAMGDASPLPVPSLGAWGVVARLPLDRALDSMSLRSTQSRIVRADAHVCGGDDVCVCVVAVGTDVATSSALQAHKHRRGAPVTALPRASFICAPQRGDDFLEAGAFGRVLRPAPAHERLVGRQQHIYRLYGVGAGQRGWNLGAPALADDRDHLPRVGAAPGDLPG
jgi:hypothetical protein